MNELFQVWLTECYQNRPHSALANNTCPEVAYRSDPKTQRFIDPDILAQAFLHFEERKVDKAGCISFNGQKHEVGLPFIGCTVDVIYDPACTDDLTIEYEGHSPWKAKKLVIGERAGRRPDLPEHLTAEKVESSRLLEAESIKRLKSAR